MYMYVYICIYICIHVNVYVCIYIFMWIYEGIYMYIRGAFNRFPDFFVPAFKIVVDS